MRIPFYPAILIVVAVAALTGCDHFKAHYADRSDAVKAGAILRGWIPGFLPQDTHSIFEEHDLDTNHVVVRCQLTPEGADALKSLASPLADHEIKRLEGTWKPSDRFWPKAFSRGNFWEVRNDYLLLKVQETDDRAALWYLAIDPSTLQVYLWQYPRKF